jgi:hypothetical protein
VRVAPKLYQRPSDRKFEAGLSINGRWTMKTLKARTKTEARKELAQLQATAATQEQQREQQSSSVATVTAAWLESFALQVARGERGARTLDHYRSNFRCHVEPHFGSSDLAAIGPDEIVAFYDALRRQGKSPYVLRACNDVLSRIFKFAIRRGLIETSAVAKLEPGERPRPRKAEQRILTHREIKALLHHAEGDALRRKKAIPSGTAVSASPKLWIMSASSATEPETTKTRRCARAATARTASAIATVFTPSRERRIERSIRPCEWP